MFSENNKLVEVLYIIKGPQQVFLTCFLSRYSNTNFPLTAALCDYVVQHSLLNQVYLPFTLGYMLSAL